jgi:hypothetical protein
MRTIGTNKLLKTLLWGIAVNATRLCARRAAGVIAAALVCAASTAWASLDAYDAAIAATTANGLTPLATLTTPVTLTGTGGAPFDFGVTTDDVTIEFILEGDPVATAASGYLAVGANSGSSLRYEQWNNTSKLGFTRGGVADYLFSPSVSSPGRATHLTYVWEAAAQTMRVYLNGILAGTASGVAASFTMPTGAGFLGATATGTEGMVGTIYRVTVYEVLVTEDVLLEHAMAFKIDLQPALDSYDAAIATDPDGLTPVTTLTAAVNLTGAGGVPFDFGATADDVTIEFILDGDPAAITPSGYLAVGANATSNLRYDQYNMTALLGFTQLGVADYLFAPAVPSPISPAHVAFVWDSAALTLTVYVNGVLGGTITGVSSSFGMPTGAGFLGANPSGTEAMVGSIYRVTVYDDKESDEAIQRHADAFTSVLRPPIIASFAATPSELLGQGTSVLTWEVQNATDVFLNGTLVTGTNKTVSLLFTTSYTLIASNEVSVATAKVTVTVTPLLDAYDAAIIADEAAGLAPIATLLDPVTLTGAGGTPFDFGANADDVTMEFILEGDTVATGNSGYLAVGANTVSNLRFEQWQNTALLGFTQLGVADYMFAPAVPSPTKPTHLVYVWNATDFSMKLYVNGSLGGAVANVSSSFAMPTGAGFLGANPAGIEAMVGTIYRIVVYDEIVSEEVIKRHADEFASLVRPPIIKSFTATPDVIIGKGSAILAWEVKNGDLVLLDQMDVTALTNLTVSPKSMTTYTLTVSNAFSTVSTKLTVAVSPKLDAYDAAILEDEAAGLAPLARLTNGVTFNGAGGAPFDFGANADDVTMEFIVEGNPAAINPSGYLAVGANATSNLRYDQWNNTAQMGLTQLGVADYFFTPAVPSPIWPTHVAYVWSAADATMKVYVNGVLAGTVSGVSSSFAMPTGAGWLGANPGGTEAMVGRIHRVVVYDDIVPEDVIQRHANALMAAADPALHAYDSAITAEAVAGLAPVARLNSGVRLTGAGGVTFDFGANADDVTMEFILEGDPVATGDSGYLAVGVNTVSSLRFEQWQNTHQLGFTQGGVADYMFTPAAASPTNVIHLTYAWNAATLTMTLYVDGVSVGTVTDVSATFAMPTGVGRLGSTMGNTETMVGTIYRVTVYDSLLTEDVILAHALAFLSLSQQPTVALDLTGATPAIILGKGIPSAHYRIEYRNSLSAADAWQLLQDIPSLSGTTARVVDASPRSAHLQRFYRAVYVQ